MSPAAKRQYVVVLFREGRVRGNLRNRLVYSNTTRTRPPPPGNTCLTHLVDSNTDASPFGPLPPSALGLFALPFALPSPTLRYNVVGVFRGYTSLSGEHERDKEGHVQMGEVVI